MKNQSIAIVVRELYGYKYEYVATFESVMDAQKYIEDNGRLGNLRMKQDILR